MLEARCSMENDNYPDRPQSPFGDAQTGPREITIGPDGQIILPPDQRRGMVGHVPVVGWLLLVQSVIQLVFSVALMVLAVMLPEVMSEALQKNPAMQNQADFSPQQLQWLVTAVYGGMGAALLLISLLGIVASVQILRFRSYTLCIVATSGTFFTLFAGFYCCVTAFPVAIYGLIVLLNGPVKQAFQLSKQGATARQIKAAFREARS